MTNVVVFHHALGLTPGVRDFATALDAAGHRVVVPDLFDGVVFDVLDDGVAHAEELGFETIIERGVAAAEEVEGPLATVGFSLGVLPAQKVAQIRSDVQAAVLCHAAVPPAMFGTEWPATVAVQLHLSEDDPWVEEDLPVARDLAANAGGELYLYPGARHLFADSTSADYDAEQAGLLLRRTLELLGGG